MSYGTWYLVEDDSKWNEMDKQSSNPQLPKYFKLAFLEGSEMQYLARHAGDLESGNKVMEFTSDECSAEVFEFHMLDTQDKFYTEPYAWTRVAIKAASRETKTKSSAVGARDSFWSVRMFTTGEESCGSYSIQQYLQPTATHHFGDFYGRNESGTFYPETFFMRTTGPAVEQPRTSTCDWERPELQCSPVKIDNSYQSHQGGHVRFDGLGGDSSYQFQVPFVVQLPRSMTGSSVSHHRYPNIRGSSNAAFTIMMWVNWELRNSQGYNPDRWQLFSTFKYLREQAGLTFYDDSSCTDPDNSASQVVEARFNSEFKLEVSGGPCDHDPPAVTQSQFNSQPSPGWMHITFTHGSEGGRKLYINGCEVTLTGNVMPRMQSMAGFGGRLYLNVRTGMQGGNVLYDDVRLYVGEAPSDFVSTTFSQPMGIQYASAVYHRYQVGLVMSLTFDSRPTQDYTYMVTGKQYFESCASTEHWYQDDNYVRAWSWDLSKSGVYPEPCMSYQLYSSTWAGGDSTCLASVCSSLDQPDVSMCTAKSSFCSSSCVVQVTDAGMYVQAPVGKSLGSGFAFRQRKFSWSFKTSNSRQNANILVAKLMFSETDYRVLMQIQLESEGRFTMCIAKRDAKELEDGECTTVPSREQPALSTELLEQQGVAVNVVVGRKVARLQVGNSFGIVACTAEEECTAATDWMWKEEKAAVFFEDDKALVKNFQVENLDYSCRPHACVTPLQKPSEVYSDAASRVFAVGFQPAGSAISLSFKASAGEQTILETYSCDTLSMILHQKESELQVCVQESKDSRDRSNMQCILSNGADLSEGSMTSVVVTVELDGSMFGLWINGAPAYKWTDGQQGVEVRKTESVLALLNSSQTILLNPDGASGFHVQDLRVFRNSSDASCTGDMPTPADKDRFCPVRPGNDPVGLYFIMAGIATLIMLIIVACVCFCRSNRSNGNSGDYFRSKGAQGVARVELFGGPQKNQFTAHVSKPRDSPLGLTMDFQADGMLLTEVTSLHCKSAGLRPQDLVTAVNDISTCAVSLEHITGLVNGTAVDDNACQYLQMKVTRPESAGAEKSGFW